MAGESIAPVNSMDDWIDSHYHYVRQRILSQNNNRVFGGIRDAQGWPFEEAKLDAFYLLYTTADPVNSSSVGGNSWTSSMYSHRIQWVWQTLGKDETSQQASPNRGDVYRTYFRLQQELLYGMYPGFCETGTWTVTAVLLDGVVNTQVTMTSYIPAEFVRFAKPCFGQRIDTATGILYATATSAISGFSPVINS